MEVDQEEWSTPKTWFELTVVTSAEALEAVSALLETLGAQGVWIDEPGLYQKENPTDWDYLDLTAPAETTVRGYFLPEKVDRARAQAEDGLAELARIPLDIGPGRLYIREVAEEQWATAWKRYFKPMKIGRLVVIPSWEQYPLGPDEVPLRLDPGMAFGTGTHPTTALCLLALQSILGRAGNERGVFLPEAPFVIDVGTGSGILGIAAARLSPATVLALDIDEKALSVTRENVERNDLLGRIQMRIGTLEPGGPEADLIVANIMADVILDLAPVARGRLNRGGVFLASGIIIQRLEEVKTRLREGGWEILEVMTQEGWAALLAQADERLHLPLSGDR
ncbi:MAG: 50S ribosomal protein L11 methyltransferase [Firmicutes bacterium]|nr:50S ribosomal protein L11 methyltransferase [Bacillota bacterium]MCL5039115.1 50S ribosomal protein L11 methyltransferase [Bacillota bacterium]